MDFDNDLPLHKVITYTRDAESKGEEGLYDIRYIINVYAVTDENDQNREVKESYTFTRRYEEDHNYSVTFNLPEGKYRFRIWSDHVTSGSIQDLYYNTTNFAEIEIDESHKHPGATEYRDAFRGNAYGEVVDPELYSLRTGQEADNMATALMKRPMGRYEFISTDIDDFLEKAVESASPAVLEALLEASRSSANDTKAEMFWNGLTRDEVAQAIGLNDYIVVFGYNAFMPGAYNLYTDKPSNSFTGITYESKMEIGSEGMRLGFDYILVDDETSMNLNMAIYNKEGELISSTFGVEVPIVRSKNTIVKGMFLTATSQGGVAINPDFEGDDFNIEIK